MPAPDAGHGAAWLKPTPSPRFTQQDPPVPPQSRHDSALPVSRPARSSQSSKPRSARKPPCRRQIPIDQTGRTAEPDPPAVSSPEACTTPADRARRTRLYPAGVRQPFTTAKPRLRAGRRRRLARGRRPAPASTCNTRQRHRKAVATPCPRSRGWPDPRDPADHTMPPSHPAAVKSP